MDREFWLVTFTGSNLTNAPFVFYVFAESAAEAERKGIRLARMASKDYEDPGEISCSSAEYIGYIEA